jgi:alpha-tubulin suppressor-like RCC1 family protein
MANLRIKASPKERMTGHGHPTLPDTLNRMMMVEHLEDGTHIKVAAAALADVATLATNAGHLHDGTAYRHASPAPGANVIPVADGSGFLDAFISSLAPYQWKVPAKLAKSFRTLSNCGWVMKDGTVRMCGLGANSALGLGTSVSDHYTPVQPGFPALIGTTVSELYISGNSCYALMANGDVYTWGANGSGQLGQGSTAAIPLPTKIAGLSNVSKIVLSKANGTHYAYVSAYFLKTDGTIYACGFNLYGQLGNGNTTNQTTPQQILNLGLPAIDIVAGANYYTSVIITLNNNTTMSCGYNLYGTLGLGDTTQRDTPVPVSGLTGVSKVVCDGDSTYGTIITYWLTSTGNVYVAGYNRIGELGLNDTTQRNSPVQITALSSISDIAVSGGNSPHTIAFMSTGGVRAWGYNASGQLGTGDTTTYDEPQTITITGSPTINGVWASGPASSGVSFLKDTSGYIYAAGHNAYGQLGVGDAVNKTSFTKVVGVCFPNTATVSEIEIYGYDASLATMFRLADGRVLGCGRNLLGMMGIYANPASDIPSYVPTPVMF